MLANCWWVTESARSAASRAAVPSSEFADLVEPDQLGQIGAGDHRAPTGGLGGQSLGHQPGDGLADRAAG